MSADDSLRALIEGNDRFVNRRPTGLGVYRYGVGNLVAGQSPYATVLGCSDSRVPPELIFDVGIGELFVIRVAGNVFSREVAGSLQYAGSHLRTPLFVVLGHRDCGAVSAALKTIEHGTRFGSHIQILVDCILPSFKTLDHDRPTSQRLDVAVECNVRWTVQQILDTPEARSRVAEGSYMIVGAIYDIETGRVKFLD